MKSQLPGTLALTAVSALLFGLAFPPTGWMPLAWIAIAPFLLALRRGGLGQALFAAWFWCVVGAVVVGDWFPRSVAVYFHQPMIVALALFVAVFTFMAGPYFLCFAWVYRALARRSGAALPFLTAAAWAAAELARGRLLTDTPLFIGNPWGILGYAQTDFLPAVQIASITGIYGVSFVLVAVNAALAELWRALRGETALRPAVTGLAGAALLAAACLGYGAAVLRIDAGGDGPETRVAIVQGNLDAGSRWDEDARGENFAVYTELTDAVGRSGGVDIVFWPEAAMTFFLEDTPAYRRLLAGLLERHGVELVAGALRREGDARDPRFFNSIYVLDGGGGVRGRYDKEYLVPFAEYFPWNVDLLRRRFGRIRIFEHGEQTAPVPTRAGPAGVVVCNESMLPEVVARRVDAGAAYLVNPSNDSWISDAKYTQQQLDIAVLRAIEQGRWLVRASTAGPSAVIDPRGRAQVVTEPLVRASAVGAIRARTQRTVYGRVGDLFALACGAAVALVLLLRRAAD